MALTNLTGLFALSLIPILILIHSLRHKPVQQQVTTLFIWEEIMKEQAGKVSVKALLKNISLLIQIIIVILIAIVLSNPVIYRKNTLPVQNIIVMDTSASMKTKTETGTRFDIAVKEAIELINKNSSFDASMIIDAGNKPSINIQFTENKTQLKTGLKQINPKDIPGNMEKAVYLALSFLSKQSNTKIYIVTDGAGYDLNSLVKLNENIIPVMVSGGEKNIGITQFEFRQRPGKKSEFEVLVELKNYTPEPVIVNLLIKSGSTEIITRKTGLAGNQKKSYVFPFSGKAFGTMTAEIQSNDDFVVDNKAWAVLSPAKKKNVYLVSGGNYFLEKFLNVYPDIRLTSSKNILESSWPDIILRNDIIILDNVKPPPSLQGNFLFLNTVAPNIPIQDLGIVKHPPITDWNKESPITKGIRLDQLRIGEAKKLLPGEVSPQILSSNESSLIGLSSGKRVTPVLESNDTVLISTYHNNGLKAVTFGFDLNQSDLPFRVAFPVLMNNIFHWLNPVANGFSSTGGSSSTSIKSGQSYEIALKDVAAPISIRGPSNKWKKIIPSDLNFIYTNTDSVGLYKVKENQNNHSFAVNLVDEKESQILPIDLPIDIQTGQPFIKHLSQTSSESSFLKKKTNNHPTQVWVLILLLVLILSMLETIFWLKKGIENF